MDTIELECPSCTELLEIDAGFAGGVCRCSNCGALMTVPSDPAHEHAETLSKRERPDSPTGSQSIPGSRTSGQVVDVDDALRDTTEASDTAKTAELPGGRSGDFAPVPQIDLDAAAPPPEPVAPKPQPTSAAEPEPEAKPQEEDEIKAEIDDEVVVYTTASGRTIRLTNTTAVPTAHKRRKVLRAGIYLIFVAALVGMGVVVYLAQQLLSGGTSTTDDDTTIEQVIGGYDPNVNPFTLKTPNMLGVPLSSRTAVLIDASSDSSSWFPLANDAALLAVRRMQGPDAFQLRYWTADGEAAWPKDDMVRAGQASLYDLKAFQDDVYPAGTSLPMSAVEKALELGPKQIVLITSQYLDDAAGAELIEMLKQHRGVRVDVVFIGTGEIPGMREFVSEQGGLMVEVPRRRLDDWYRDVRDDVFNFDVGEPKGMALPGVGEEGADAGDDGKDNAAPANNSVFGDAPEDAAPPADDAPPAE